jgi:hypothetical protein
MWLQIYTHYTDHSGWRISRDHLLLLLSNLSTFTVLGGAAPQINMFIIPSGKLTVSIEHGHRNSWFTPAIKWWCSIVMWLFTRGYFSLNTFQVYPQKKQPVSHWIGLIENLQETPIFSGRVPTRRIIHWFSERNRERIPKNHGEFHHWDDPPESIDAGDSTNQS